MAEKRAADPTLTLGYQAKRGGINMTLKPAIHNVSEVIIEPIKDVIAPLTPDFLQNLGAGGASALSGPALLTLMGLTAGLSAGLTFMDYNHRIAHLRDSD